MRNNGIEAIQDDEISSTSDNKFFVHFLGVFEWEVVKFWK